MAQRPPGLFDETDPIVPRPFEGPPPLPTTRGPGLFDEAQDPLRRALDQARDTTPDQAARTFRLQQQTHLPAELVQRNLDALERQRRVDGFDPARFRTTNPGLARWIEQGPQHAAIVQDDLEPLSAIERALQIAGRSARALTTGPLSISAGIFGGMRVAGEALGGGQREFRVRGARIPGAGYEPTEPSVVVEESLEIQRIRDLRTDRAFDATTLARDAAIVADRLRATLRGDRTGVGFVEGAVYSGLESLSLTVSALPAAAVGGPGALVGVLGAVTGGESASRARTAGHGLGVSVAYGAIDGVIEAATELVPAKWFLQDLATNAGFWRALKHQLLSEAPSEQFATAFQDLNAWALIRPDATLGDYWRERPSRQTETLIATLVAVGGQSAIVYAGGRAGGKPPSQQLLEDLHAAAAASTTQTRAPEAMTAVVEQLAAAGGLTHVFAPAASFVEYFQTQGEDPVALAATLTGDPDALRLALVSNGDLAIPTATYLAHAVGSGHEAFYAEEIRLGANQANARETRERMAHEADSGDTAGLEPDAVVQGRRVIHESMTAKLAATNRYAAADIDAIATLYASVFTSLGSRAGVDPLVLFRRFEPTVVNEGVAPVVRPGENPMQPAAGLDIPASAAGRNETRAQAITRRQGHDAALVAGLTRDARQTDPTVDPVRLEAEIRFRLGLYEEQQDARRQSGRGQDLLRAIAGRGGIRVTDGDRGELQRYAIEGRDAVVKASGEVVLEKLRLPDGRMVPTWNGVPGVFTDDGRLSIDEMTRSLMQDERFGYLEDELNNLLVALEAAMSAERVSDALPGTADLRAVRIEPGTAWWTDWWSGEAAPAATDPVIEDDVPFDPAEFGDATEEPFEQPAFTVGDRIEWWVSGEGRVRTRRTGTVVEVLPRGHLRATADGMQGELAVRMVRPVSQPRALGTTRELAFEQPAAPPEDFDAVLFAWADQVQARYGDDLVKFDVEMLGDDIVLGLLVVKEGARSAGVGSAVMRDLTAFADQHGKRILGILADPSQPWGTTSTDRLRTFYGRFGFTNHAPTDDEPWDIQRDPATDAWDLTEIPRHAASTFAEARAAAKAFQGKPLPNTSTGREAILGRDALDKMLSESAVRKSSSPAEHALAVANLDHLFERAIRGISHADRAHDPNIPAIHRFFAPLRVADGSNRLVMLTVKELAARGELPRLYSVQAVEVEQSGPASILGVAASSTEGGRPDSTRPAGPVLSLANQIREFNARRDTEFEQEDPPDGWRTVETSSDSPKNQPPGAMSLGSFNPETLLIRLRQAANRSTFLHESAHLYLEILSSLALGPDAPPQMAADMATLLADWQFDGDLAAWRALTHEQRRDQHEQFARGFELYLGEGRAPTPELQPVFARFRSWLLGVYRTLRRLHVTLSPDVRKVMDRLVAADDAIAAAEADAGIAALFTDAASAGVSPTEFEGYRTQVQAASDAARDRLQTRLLRQLAREQERWWQDERDLVLAEVAAEVAGEPVYRALAGMRGTLPEAPATPLARQRVVAEFGRDVLRQLPRPFVYSRDSGLPPDTVAQLYGFTSGAALIDAVLAAEPIEERINRLADDRMLERHGDLLKDPAQLADLARDAVADEHRATVVRAELAMLRKLQAAAKPTARAAAADQASKRREGAERLRTELPDAATLQRLAQAQIASMRLSNIRPDRFYATARRASRRATERAGRQDYDAAVEAKQTELVNLALYREALAAREAVDEARERFGAMFKPDAEMATRRNMDLVHAARAIAASYFWPERRQAAAHDALELVRKHDDELYAVLEEQIRAARSGGGQLGELTFEGFQVMASTVDGLWERSLRERQQLVAGQLVDRNDVKAALAFRLDELGAPDQQTPRTWGQMALLGAKASLTRVEHWIDYMDGGDPNGAFRRYLWSPIVDATGRYRLQKAAVLDQFLAILQPIEATLKPGAILAPELPGKVPGTSFTFDSKSALLHAIAHTGNASNYQKLLRGYGWASYRPDGSLDDSKWTRFLERMHAQGIVTKADWDVVQALWDLNESLKADAQAAHREMYGRYFGELTAWPVHTPFGAYRGGYMPALVDALKSADAAVRDEKHALGENANAGMFPTTGRGWSKQRVEAYARPLALDLRLVPGHLDKVLRFIHLEPRVKEIGRLLWDHGMRARLDAYNPTTGSDLLVPWLQRTAQQKVTKASQGWGGRGADAFFRTLRQRTGLNLMAGNVINTLQQFTGLSTARLKVDRRYLRNALWRYTTAHDATIAAVHEASPFMRTRLSAQAFEIMTMIDDLLLNPTKYEQARDFGNKHGYFIQAGTQNVVDVITWAGAYEQATVRGAVHDDAVRQADSAVRETQGSFAPEDVASIEVQIPFIRAFLQFFGFFNLLANLNGAELAKVVRDMGLRKGAGRGLLIYTFGFMVPSVLSEVIRQSFVGFEDDDDESHLDEAMALFFGSQARVLAAMVPGGVVSSALSYYTTKTTFDDRVSSSPAFNLIESTIRAPWTVYDAITDDGSKKRAVRDLFDAVGLLTGLPVGALKRPAAYLTDVAEGTEEPENLGELVGGLVSGRGRQQ